MRAGAKSGTAHAGGVDSWIALLPIPGLRYRRVLADPWYRNPGYELLLFRLPAPTPAAVRNRI